ncbi:hypothetical protein IWW50_003327 [Coemansia erecta]|nr:hypothetical protein IWW50_003327 [Coemansia erecta]
MRFTQRLGSNDSTTKATEADVTHLLILVPGTGPQSENETPKGSFTKKAARFREMIKDMCANEFGATGAHVEMVRILYHADLHALDTAKARMDKVTLPSIPWIRTIDNERIGDILYYYSTTHGHRLLAMIIGKLNAAYDAFVTAHPTFAGPVSIVAHSLGGLICYEILYMMHARRRGCVPGGAWEQRRFEGLPDLKFTPERLFSMGSPHGGTMVFRQLDFGEYAMGTVGFHNIFHPYDPFGYRTEPLVDDAYADVPAVPITMPDASRTSSLGQRGVRNRRSLGSSISDIGKTFVDAMVVAPVTLSSTMLRAAKSSVAAPLNAVANRHANARRATDEAGGHMRRISSFLGFTPSSDKQTPESSVKQQTSDSADKQQTLDSADKLHTTESSADDEPEITRRPRRHSIGRLLPFTFSRRAGRTASEGENHHDIATPRRSPSPAQLSFACNSHVTASLGMMAEVHDEPTQDEPSSTDSRLHEYTMDTGSTQEHRRRVLRSRSHSMDAARSRHVASDSDEASDETVSEHIDDMMLGQLVRIFSLSRPPGRSQQLAEAQGLPLSSHVLCRPAKQRLASRTEPPALRLGDPSYEAPPAPPPTANDIANMSSRLGDVSDGVRRANTLPLAVANGRRMARAIVGHSTFACTSPPADRMDLNHPPTGSVYPRPPTDSTDTHPPTDSTTPCPPIDNVGTYLATDSTDPQPPALAQAPGRSVSASPALSSPSSGLASAPTQSVSIETPSEPDLPYNERMDYIVPFTKRHLHNEYWLGFQAHFSYWVSRDVIYHILHHVITKPNPAGI